MRKRQLYIDKYGPIAGSKLYHALQSQAAHAGVSARLRRKLEAISSGQPWPPARARADILPLFPHLAPGTDVDATEPALELVGAVTVAFEAPADVADEPGSPEP
ncbi:hypothetical protein [Aquisphaera giovannonii]|nr:hypothetical protein [Aquisphaera giovannonii]